MEPISNELSSPVQLDAVFAALADPTRRAILARLATGEAAVNELAAPFAMSQPAISKHLKVLERAGLVSRGRDAQRRPRRLETRPLAEASEWIERYRRLWEANYARLDALLDELRKIETSRNQARTQATIEEKTPMPETGTLQVTTPSEREIALTRVFDAPRRLIFDAHTKPELVRRWLLGPPGWTMPVCEIDLRVGGRYRWVWKKEKTGDEMGIGGVYREIAAPERLVATERFDESWYPGEAVNTLVLVEHGGQTTLTQTSLYESRAARDTALQSGMEKGVEVSYDRLAELLAAMPAA